MTVDFKLQKPMDLFRRLCNDNLYVDRTDMISHLNTLLDTDNKYICVTSEENCGKTSMAGMIASYYSNLHDCRDIFERMKASSAPGFEKHLNKHNVLYIDMSRKLGCSYENYICSIEEKIIKQLARQFSNVKISINNSIRRNFEKLYNKKDESYIFILDEWDYVLRKDEYSDDEKRDYLMFLAELCIDADYVTMAYLTGEKPISYYTDLKCFERFDEYLLNM